MKKIQYIICVALILTLGFAVHAQGGKFFKFLNNPTVYKAYSTPEEFLKDGGQWDEIQTFDDSGNLGSVASGGEYHATSTAPATGGFLNATTPTLIKAGSGTFGSVVVIKAGTAGGRYSLYNATTSNITQRNNIATSSVIITSLPTDLAAGVYTFDVAFTDGLLVDWTGTIGTTTITWR